MVKSTDLALLVLRVMLGATFVAHDAQKLFGAFGGPGLAGWTDEVAGLGLQPAAPMALLAALCEFGGGLLLVVGPMTPLGALAVATTMVFAIATVSGQNGFFNENGGSEFNLALISMAAALVLAGGGSYSLDRALLKGTPHAVRVALRQTPGRDQT